MDLVTKVRDYMTEHKIDYLLVNSTNEFLEEYSPLEENSRYLLTGFSGSSGDALLTSNDIFLFVDGRYHQQAELEVKKGVSIVKMKLKQSFSDCFLKKIKKNKTLAICARKNSQGRFETLKKVLNVKNVSLKLLESDPVEDLMHTSFKKKKSQIEIVSDSIVGISADKKLKMLSNKISNNEAILITNPEEVSYICNLRDFSSNFSSQIKAKILVMKDFSVLFTSENIDDFSKKIETFNLDEFANYIKTLKSIDKIFVDKTSINAYDYSIVEKKADFFHENMVKKMKSIKNEAEINHYKTSFERTDKTLAQLRDYIITQENLSEFDISEKLVQLFYENGAKSLSFKPIVAIGKNSALAHYSKNSKEEFLKEGRMVLVDCGAYYEGGYATDITRVFIKGKASGRQKKVYTAVLKGFLAAFNKKINARTSGYSLDKTARKILEKEAPKNFEFIHALGHGIGINVHESPPSIGLSPIAKSPLEPNMCFTIEPGLYKKGFGGVRLENSCFLAKNGEELLIKSFSNMCFEEELIDFEMLSAREKKWLKNFEVK